MNKVLSWIEDGAFAALRDGVLSMILFGVYTDEQDPTTLTEAWYFRVAGCGTNLQVARGEEDGQAPSESSASWMNGFSGGSGLVGETTDQVTKLSSNFIRTVVALNSALDDLPEVRPHTCAQLSGEQSRKTPPPSAVRLTLPRSVQSVAPPFLPSTKQDRRLTTTHKMHKTGPLAHHAALLQPGQAPPCGVAACRLLQRRRRSRPVHHQVVPRRARI